MEIYLAGKVVSMKEFSLNTDLAVFENWLKTQLGTSIKAIVIEETVGTTKENFLILER
jgi:hypothetical protein